VNLLELSETLVEMMAVTDRSHGTDFSVFVSPLLPPWVLGDPTRLRQILLNLLGNASKFSRSADGRGGRVKLALEPGILASGAAGLQLRVTDNGIGISPQAQAKLFQAFTQADESTARRFGGTGLGLSISQQLVELMGGRISVRSSLGDGAEFTVMLPLQATAAPHFNGGGVVDSPLASDATLAAARLAGLQVLVLTRDAVKAHIIQSYGVAAGAEVTTVVDLANLRRQLRPAGRDAAASPSAHEVLVVLGLDFSVPLAELELELPAGVGVLRLNRHNRLDPAQPLQPLQPDPLDGEAGVMPLCASPLLQGELINALALASGRLALRTDRRLGRQRCSWQVAPTVAQAVASRRLILLADDNEVNREVMQEQLRLVGYASELAVDGLEALAMWRSGRYALLLTDCHMPRMDGFELTANIRQSELAGQRLPIIAITANAMQGEAQRCRERGMNDYLSKPLRMEDLLPMLEKWLPLADAPDAPDAPVPLAPRAEPVPEPEPELLAVWDAATLVAMVGDNPKLHLRLLAKFLENAEEQMDALQQAAVARNFAAAADLAHSLKSSARMVGALRLGELCEAAESAWADMDKDEESATVDALSGTLNSAFAEVQAAISQHRAPAALDFQL
jgi:two-component system sensor histidine kinase/response regulator